MNSKYELASEVSILRLTPHFYTKPSPNKQWDIKLDPLGGMQVQIERLSRELDIKQDVMTITDRNYRDEIVLSNNLKVHSSLFPMIKFKSKLRGTLGLNIMWSLGVIFQVIKNKKKLQEEISVIHTHCSGVVEPLITGIMVSVMLNKPLVYTIHCSRNMTYHPMSWFDKLINPLIKKIEVLCIKKSNKTIVLTERVRKNYVYKSKINMDKLVVIPDSIDANILESNSTKYQLSKELLEFIGDKKVILYCGRIAHEKGWRTFVEIAEHFKHRDDIIFLMCGDGNEREELENEINRKNLKSKILITGFVDKELVPSIMNKSDIIIVPSIHEELGGVLLEAIAMKKYIIASEVGGIPEILTGTTLGKLVKFDDVKSYVKAIETRLASEDVFDKNEREDVLKRYSLRESKTLHNKIYYEAKRGV